MINTERLVIKLSTIDDLDDMYLYVSNKEVMRYERENYETKDSFKRLLEILMEHNIMYSLRLKSQAKVIGHITLSRTNPSINNEYNLGYIINPDYQGKGYCTEASKMMVGFAFDVLEANRVRAACNPENIPSWKVMEKIGLMKEGFYKKKFFMYTDTNNNGVYTDEVTYGIHIDDWRKKNN